MENWMTFAVLLFAGTLFSASADLSNAKLQETQHLIKTTEGLELALPKLVEEHSHTNNENNHNFETTDEPRFGFEPRHHPHHIDENLRQFETRTRQPHETRTRQPFETRQPITSSLSEDHTILTHDSGDPNWYPVPSSDQTSPYSYRAGVSTYFDPGVDVQASGDQLLNTVLTVAILLFAVSVIIPFIDNIIGLLVYCGLLKAYWLGSLTQKRSLEDIVSIFDEENIETYTELASRAFELYDDMNATT